MQLFQTAGDIPQNRVGSIGRLHLQSCRARAVGYLLCRRGTLLLLDYLFCQFALCAQEQNLLEGATRNCALVLLIGSKLTGPVFAAISILVFFVAAFIGGEKRDFFWKYKGVFGQLAIWSIVAVAVVGYSPYVENVAAGKHVFYPVLGKDKVDVMKRQASAHFLAMNPLHRLFLSYFSMPSDCEACEESEPSFVPSPTHVRAAIGALHTADTRFGGFGPFFGFMLISCLASFFWRRKHADVVKLYLLATLVIVLAHPQLHGGRAMFRCFTSSHFSLPRDFHPIKGYFTS